MKGVHSVRCWWCEARLHPSEALLDRATGKVKCRECATYDATPRNL